MIDQPKRIKVTAERDTLTAELAAVRRYSAVLRRAYPSSRSFRARRG